MNNRIHHLSIFSQGQFLGRGLSSEIRQFPLLSRSVLKLTYGEDDTVEMIVSPSQEEDGTDLQWHNIWNELQFLSQLAVMRAPASWLCIDNRALKESRWRGKVIGVEFSSIIKVRLLKD